MTAAARSYLNAIGGMAASGHFLGHSFGGWIVFEMALNLLERGCVPKSVTILDAQAPEGNHKLGLREYNRTELLLHQIEMIELVVGRRIDLVSKDLQELNESEQRRLLHEILIREGLFPRRSTPDILRGPLRTFAASVRTPYTPSSSYSANVHLIVVDDPRLDQDTNRLRHLDLVTAWRKWAPNLTWSHAPGNHLTVLKPPYVSALARILQSLIL